MRILGISYHFRITLINEGKLEHKKRYGRNPQHFPWEVGWKKKYDGMRWIKKFQSHRGYYFSSELWESHEFTFDFVAPNPSLHTVPDWHSWQLIALFSHSFWRWRRNFLKNIARISGAMISRGKCRENRENKKTYDMALVPGIRTKYSIPSQPSLRMLFISSYGWCSISSISVSKII